MKPAEVCAALGITPLQFAALAASGQLPVLRLGRHYRVPERAVEEYIARQLPEPAAVPS